MRTKHLSALTMALLLSSVLLFFVYSNNTAQGSTNFSGVISSDTTWTKANSPYQINGNVLVNKDVTLTIQPGVTVNFEIADYYIMVNGTLRAIGTPDDPIIINSGKILFTEYSSPWNPYSNAGSIVSGCVINVPAIAFQLRSASPLIANSTILSAGTDTGATIVVEGGKPQICNNTIRSADGAALYLSSTNSVISSNIIYGIPSIGNSYPGEGIHAYNDKSLVQKNVIINCNIGLYLFAPRFNDNPNLSWIIKNNAIINNSIGIATLDSPNATILYNTIQNNSQYDVQCSTFVVFSGDINATYNWWGTTDTTAIAQSIYDYNDDFTLGIVTFTPLLTSPNTVTPTCISASAGAGGSISPSGINRLNYGDSKTFTITANAGLHVTDVLVNGSSVGAVTSHTVQDITSLTTISATFAVDPTPTPTSIPSPTPISTAAPTVVPTTNPTSQPTSIPTSHPTTSPTQIPISTPTSTPNVPEFSSIAIVIIMLIAAAAAMLFYRRSTYNQVE